MRKEKLRKYIPQPRQVDGLGKDGGYSAHLFYGDVYLANRDRMLKLATGIATASGVWTPKDLTPASGLWSVKTTRKLVSKGKEDKGGKIHTSMIFFLRSVLDADSLDTSFPYKMQEFSEMISPKYIGFSWQEMVYVPVQVLNQEGEKHIRVIPVLYFRLRAFEEEHRRQHLGKAAIQLALWAYSSATHLAHRTASPPAADSFLESRVHKFGRRFPWDATYDTDRVMGAIKDVIFEREHVKGKSIDPVTGVSIGDYPEVNRAYTPDLTHPRTMVIKTRMEEEFSMVFSRGDALYSVYQLR